MILPVSSILETPPTKPSKSIKRQKVLPMVTELLQNPQKTFCLFLSCFSHNALICIGQVMPCSCPIPPQCSGPSAVSGALPHGTTLTLSLLANLFFWVWGTSKCHKTCKEEGESRKKISVPWGDDACSNKFYKLRCICVYCRLLKGGNFSCMTGI